MFRRQSSTKLQEEKEGAGRGRERVWESRSKRGGRGGIGERGEGKWINLTGDTDIKENTLFYSRFGVHIQSIKWSFSLFHVFT